MTTTQPADGSQPKQTSGGHPSGPIPTGAPLERHNLTTPGFVVALVGAVLSLIPLLGVVSWIISPIGLVLSLIAVSQHRPGRPMAGWGVGLGAFGLLICFVWAAAIGGGYSSSTSGSSSPSSSNGYSSSSSSVDPSGSSTSAAASGTYTDGTYVVGSELAPGRYRTSGADSSALFKFCMASREQSDGSVIGFPETTNEGPAFITVQSSDSMVKFSGPCSWTKVG